MGGLLAALDDDRRALKLPDNVAGDDHGGFRGIYRRLVAIKGIVGDRHRRTLPHPHGVALFRSNASKRITADRGLTLHQDRRHATAGNAIVTNRRRRPVLHGNDRRHSSRAGKLVIRDGRCRIFDYADSDQFIVEALVPLNDRNHLVLHADSGQFVFPAFVAEDQRFGTALTTDARHLVIAADVGSQDRASSVTAPDPGHFVLVALVTFDNGGRTFHANTDACPPILVALVAPHDGLRSFSTPDACPDVLEAHIVSDHWVGLTTADPGPQVLFAGIATNDRLGPFRHADSTAHVAINEVTSDERFCLRLVDTENADPDIAVVVNDAVGDGATHALNADGWVGSFRLDRTFFIAQFFTLRIKVLPPSGLVVEPNVRDRKAVERTALGHHNTGFLVFLFASVDDRCLGPRQPIDSLGVIPFALQDDARLETNAFLIHTGGNGDSVARLR